MLLDCVIYCAFYSILFRGAVFSGHGVYTCIWPKLCLPLSGLCKLSAPDRQRPATEKTRRLVPGQKKNQISAQMHTAFTWIASFSVSVYASLNRKRCSITGKTSRSIIVGISYLYILCRDRHSVISASESSVYVVVDDDRKHSWSMETFHCLVWPN